MAREKKIPTPNDPPASSDGTGAGEPAPVLVSAAPAPRTQDRNPADRLAWKRERAKALGHDRH